MIVHELATNAARHGALSTPEGRVSVGWHVSEDTVRFEWAESDGPRVKAAREQSGFGLKLIDQIVSLQFKGSLETEWLDRGYRVQFNIPAESLAI